VKFTEDDFKNMMKNTNDPILVDIKGIYRSKIKDIQYWSF
jgi:hypothetical protein